MTGIQLSGLGGFDSSSVVTQLVNIATQPVTDLNTRKSKVDSASTTMSSFSNLLLSLKSAATALATPGGFSSMAATSSDSGIVASISGTALPSSYSVEVSQLAQAQKTRSDPQGDATVALGQAGDMTFTTGTGTPVTVTIVDTDSLTDIATKITNSGARISGSIINAGGSYRLSLQGLDTGAASAFTVDEGGTISLGLSTQANQVAPAQDAKLTIDKLPVTSPTNQISGAIQGVTLALTKTTTSAATLNIAADSTALKQKITTFVSAYNAVINAGHADAGYGTTPAQNSELAADTGVRRTLNMISSKVSGLVPGSSGAYQSLATVGVNLATDGTMVFDPTKLDAAIAKDPTSVAKLFVTDANTGATGMMKTLADAIDDDIHGPSGAVKLRIDELKALSAKLADSATKKQKQVDDYQAQLKAQFAALDQAMSKYSAMSASMQSLINPTPTTTTNGNGG